MRAAQQRVSPTLALNDQARDITPALVDGANDPGELERLVRRQLELLGEDPDRPGLQKTPARVAASLSWLTRGHGVRVEDVVGNAVFEEEHESMVMVRDIELYSMCEHHML